MQAENIIPTRATSNKIPAPESSRTQRARILRLLIEASGAEVPLPEIAACACQYGARIFELRRLGFVILNRTEDRDGERRSWFRLVSGPPQADTSTPAAADRVPSANSQTKSAGDATSDPRVRQLALF
jgi:hypothetical protein